VKRRGSLGIASLATSLACAAGCSQVLGLDSYGSAGGDAGADATLDAPATTDSGTTTGDAAGDRGDQVDSAPASDSGGALDVADVRSDTGAADAPVMLDANAPPDAPGFDAGAGCSGNLTCAPPVPPGGWTGPLVLWEGSGSAPACGSGFNPAYDGGANGAPASATCTCTCGSPTGATCSAPVLSFNNKNNCHGMACGMVSLSQGACTDVGSTGASCGSLSASSSTASGGTCAADASASVPPWSWGSLAEACMPSALPDAGCGAGGQCMPLLPLPFEAHVCILKQGTGACPGGGYDIARVYYGGAQDTRGCSSCSCGSPATGVDCNANAQVVLWSSTGCDAGTTLVVSSPNPSNCETPVFKTQGATFTTTPKGGTCTPVGGQATGGIVPQDPTTICCTQ
jgi:hypothetical protein